MWEKSEFFHIQNENNQQVDIHEGTITTSSEKLEPAVDIVDKSAIMI